MKHIFTFFLAMSFVVCDIVSAQLEPSIAAGCRQRKSMLPEDAKILCEHYMRVYCVFVKADKSSALRVLYAISEYQNIFDKLIKVLDKPQYKDFGKYYRIYKNIDGVNDLENTQMNYMEKFMQLQLAALKEAGVSEKRIDIKKVDDESAQKNNISDIVIRVHKDVGARLKYDNNLKYYYLSVERENDPKSVSLGIQGLPIRISGVEPIAEMRPFGYFESLKQIVKDADGFSTCAGY